MLFVCYLYLSWGSLHVFLLFVAPARVYSTPRPPSLLTTLVKKGLLALRSASCLVRGLPATVAGSPLPPPKGSGDKPFLCSAQHKCIAQEFPLHKAHHGQTYGLRERGRKDVH